MGSEFKPKALAEGEEIQVSRTREVVDGVMPFFREKPTDIALTEGEPLNMSALVSSEPRAAIQWLKNDLIFMDDSRLRVVNTEDGWSHLTLDPAMPSDAGLYKVVARNPLGQTSCTVRVVLGDISGPPDSPVVEAMTDTDILLSWQTPAQLNHSPVNAYKVQMGYIDTDIDWVDLADDITHEYFVVDNLRPSHGYKFRVLAKNQFGWSNPSIPSGIVMTPSSGASRAEFYDALQQVQAKGDIEEVNTSLNYDCEKKPMKLKTENPGSLDFMNEISRTSKLFAMRRLFLCLMDLKLTRCLSSSSPQCQTLMSCLILLRGQAILSRWLLIFVARFLMLLTTSTGEERSTLTLSQPTFL